jgi:mannose-6-phosphate isomerase-like protein (cupin superfamily)
VKTTGPIEREGETQADGSIRFTNMRAGTYRLRFTRDGRSPSSATSRCVPGEAATVEGIAERRSGACRTRRTSAASHTNSAAARVLRRPEGRARAHVSGEELHWRPRGTQDSPLGCTPTATATLHQLRDSWLSHSHDDADEWIYVVAGEGTLRMSAGDQRLQAGTFVLVPHGMAHSLVPQGRNPLIVTSVLSGPACKAQG